MAVNTVHIRTSSFTDFEPLIITDELGTYCASTDNCIKCQYNGGREGCPNGKNSRAYYPNPKSEDQS